MSADGDLLWWPQLVDQNGAGRSDFVAAIFHCHLASKRTHSAVNCWPLIRWGPQKSAEMLQLAVADDTEIFAAAVVSTATSRRPAWPGAHSSHHHRQLCHSTNHHCSIIVTPFPLLFLNEIPNIQIPNIQINGRQESAIVLVNQTKRALLSHWNDDLWLFFSCGFAANRPRPFPVAALPSRTRFSNWTTNPEICRNSVEQQPLGPSPSAMLWLFCKSRCSAVDNPQRRVSMTDIKAAAGSQPSRSGGG